MLDRVPLGMFVNKYIHSTEGMKKQAQQSLDDYIRIQIREGGIVRSSILPTLPITAKDLDKDEDPMINKKFIPMEISSEGGTWIPYRANPPMMIVKGRRVPAYFGEITSVKHVMNIYENLTSEIDLRKMLQDQDVKEIQKVEDQKFLTTVDTICAANPAQQLKVYSGGLSKNNWIAAIQDFKSLPYKIPLACALMNDWTYAELLKWPFSTDVPYTGEEQRDMYKNGYVGQISGVKILQTIKSDLVPNRVVYFFSNPDFMGKFYELQAPTTLIKQEGNTIEFYTMEVVGMALPNIRSFVKCTFNA